MADEINTLTARKLRTAMKAVEGKDVTMQHVPPDWLGDRAEVRSTFYTTGKKDLMMCILRDGEVIAMAPVTRQAVKRFRAEINSWNDAQSGFHQSYSQHRGFRDMRKDG